MSPFGLYMLCRSCDKARVLQSIAVHYSHKNQLIDSLCLQHRVLERAWLDALDLALERNHLQPAYDAHQPTMEIERQIFRLTKEQSVFETSCIEQFEKRWGTQWQNVDLAEVEPNEVEDWARKVSGGLGVAEYPGRKGWITFKLA